MHVSLSLFLSFFFLRYLLDMLPCDATGALLPGGGNIAHIVGEVMLQNRDGKGRSLVLRSAFEVYNDTTTDLWVGYRRVGDTSVDAIQACNVLTGGGRRYVPLCYAPGGACDPCGKEGWEVVCCRSAAGGNGSGNGSGSGSGSGSSSAGMSAKNTKATTKKKAPRVRKLASTVYDSGSKGEAPAVDSGAWRCVCALKHVPRGGGIQLAPQMVLGRGDLSFSCGVLASARVIRSYVKRDMTVTVHVIRALGLKAMDMSFGGGTSDPYAKVRLVAGGSAAEGGGDTIDEGETAPEMKTLQPIWDSHVSVTAPTPTAAAMGEMRVRIEVFDFDAIGSDDWIGLVDVKLTDLINNAIPDEYALPSNTESRYEELQAVIGKKKPN